jgi:F0F1-type ATP synthase assembly protein I
MTEPTGGRGPVSPLGFAVLGSELVGFTLVGLFFDWLLGWLPWCTIGGLVGGLMLVLLHMAQMTGYKPPPGPKGPKP